MDLRSLSSSQSDLILLISTESVDLPCPPPSSSPQTIQNDNLQYDGGNYSVYGSVDSHGATSFGSEIVLTHMEARKKSKKVQARANRESRPEGKDGPASLHKLSNPTEDSSSQGKPLGTKPTFDTLRTEKTGRSSIGSWIKKKVLRMKGSSKDAASKKANKKSKTANEKNTQVPGHVLVDDEAESIGTNDRDELSTFLGSLSISDVHKLLGSQDNSIEVMEHAYQTATGDDFTAATFSELLDEPAPLRFDFRDRLELYKGRSATKKHDDVQDKVERLHKEASFMLLSFSLAPSDSESLSRETDEDTTDDNLAEAIAKEMNLRRLIMGEPEPPGINIKEVTIPSKKSKANAVLSPRMNAARPNWSSPSQIDKPATPLEQIAGFFFGNNENMDSPHAPCGMREDFHGNATISP